MPGRQKRKKAEKPPAQVTRQASRAASQTARQAQRRSSAQAVPTREKRGQGGGTRTFASAFSRMAHVLQRMTLAAAGSSVRPYPACASTASTTSESLTFIWLQRGRRARLASSESSEAALRQRGTQAGNAGRPADRFQGPRDSRICGQISWRSEGGPHQP